MEFSSPVQTNAGLYFPKTRDSSSLESKLGLGDVPTVRRLGEEKFGWPLVHYTRSTGTTKDTTLIISGKETGF